MAKPRAIVEEKFRNNFSQAGNAWEQGLRNPRRSWSAGYAASYERMRQATLEAFNQGRHLDGVNQLGDQNFVSRAIEKRANFTGSVDRAVTNYMQRYDEIAQAADAMQGAVSSMPNATPEQREQRMLAAVRAARQFWSRRQ